MRSEKFFEQFFKNLESWDVQDKGLKLAGLFLLPPVLNFGLIKDFFRTDGIKPWLKDFLHKIVMGTHNKLAHFLKSIDGRPSGPAVLVIGSSFIISNISSSDICISESIPSLYTPSLCDSSYMHI